MAYTDKRVALDRQGNIVPQQVYNPDTDSFEPIQGSGSGGAKMQLTGSKDTDGSSGPAISFTLDDNGRPVLRVVDAAPFAYDETYEALVTVPKVKEPTVTTLQSALAIASAGNAFAVGDASVGTGRDCLGIKRVAVHVVEIGGTAHDFDLIFSYNDVVGNISSIGSGGIQSGYGGKVEYTSQNSAIAVFDVVGSKYKIRLFNNDASQRTYSVAVYEYDF